MAIDVLAMQLVLTVLSFDVTVTSKTQISIANSPVCHPRFFSRKFPVAVIQYKKINVGIIVG